MNDIFLKYQGCRQVPAWTKLITVQYLECNAIRLLADITHSLYFTEAGTMYVSSVYRYERRHAYWLLIHSRSMNTRKSHAWRGRGGGDKYKVYAPLVIRIYDLLKCQFLFLSLIFTSLIMMASMMMCRRFENKTVELKCIFIDKREIVKDDIQTSTPLLFFCPVMNGRSKKAHLIRCRVPFYFWCSSVW